ncbi:MAG: hypothetical protein CL685_03925 [Candidatus Magasanikbacteria bacterium]|nr:hypothetical protein [Candidatus Magasanikbacteria bacterium]|tara:strand:- start:2742 stop:3533 length:792 start_codon:yes stop_codon:yes gene_type:complete
MKKTCFVSIDVEEDFVSDESINRFFGVEKLSSLIPLFKKRNVRATLFCTGRVLEKYGSVLRQFKQCGHEIALHGFYDHVNIQNQTQEEKGVNLQKHIRVYTELFGTPPLGFRAVQNTIDNASLTVLEQYDIVYDSSVISRYVPFKKYIGYTGRASRFVYYPNKENFLQAGNRQILEIPLSPPLFGVQLQGKWIKGLRASFYAFWINLFAPRLLSVSFHSWDLYKGINHDTDETFIHQLDKILAVLQKKGYIFSSGKEIYEANK